MCQPLDRAQKAHPWVSETLCPQIICLLLEGCSGERESIEWAWNIWTQHLSTQRQKAPRCSTNTLSSFLTQWHLVSLRTQIMPPRHRDLPWPPHMNKTPPSPSHCIHQSLLCLHLHCCPADRFISTVFLDSMYMCWYMIFVFLFLTYFTLCNRLEIHPSC